MHLIQASLLSCGGCDGQFQMSVCSVVNRVWVLAGGKPCCVMAFLSPVAHGLLFLPLEERADLTCRQQGLLSRFPFTVPVLKMDTRDDSAQPIVCVGINKHTTVYTFVLSPLYHSTLVISIRCLWAGEGISCSVDPYVGFYTCQTNREKNVI